MEEEEEKLFGEGESSIHCMTLPRELSYRNGELCQLPVRELEKVCAYIRFLSRKDKVEK